MRKMLFVIAILIGACLLVSSCEKIGGVERTVVGTWVCIEQTAVLEDGTSITYSDKEDWLKDKTYITFPYCFRFEKDGYFATKDSYQDDFCKPRIYTIRDGIFYEMDIPGAWVDLKGNKLVLSLKEGDQMLDAVNALNALVHLERVKSIVATYKKE